MIKETRGVTAQTLTAARYEGVPDKRRQARAENRRTKKPRMSLSQLIALLFYYYNFFSSNCSSPVCMCVVCICVLFLSVPASLMGCHPGLSRKAASSVGLGINPGIMALMPS